MRLNPHDGLPISPAPASALPLIAQPVSPDILRILRTRYLDRLGLWRIDLADPHRRLRFDRARAARYLLAIALWFILFAAWFSLFWWFGRSSPEIRFFLAIMAWIGGLGIFALAFVARAVEILLEYRRGPWITIDQVSREIEFPRQQLRVSFKHLEWAVLYSQNEVNRRTSAIAELTLTAQIAGERCCISITPRYGKKSLAGLDRFAAALADLTNTTLKRLGYPVVCPPLNAS